MCIILVKIVLFRIALCSNSDVYDPAPQNSNPPAHPRSLPTLLNQGISDSPKHVGCLFLTIHLSSHQAS